MPTLRSHTHLQAAQADTQAKACKRVCLPNRTRILQTRHDSTSAERRPACNSTYPKGGVSCSKDSLVVNQTLVFQIKLCGESPVLRVAPKRWGQGCSIAINFL